MDGRKETTFKSSKDEMKFYDPNDHSVYNFIPTLLIHIQLNRNCKLLVSSIKQTLHFKIPGHWEYTYL